MGAVEERLGCARDVLGPEVALRVHRVQTMAAFLARRDERVAQALAAAYAANPGQTFPLALLPEGHPIRAQEEGARALLVDDPGVDPPEWAAGALVTDGIAARRVPSGRAALVQQVDASRQVIATHYRWPDDSGIDWLITPEVSPVAANAPQAPVVPLRPTRHRAPMLLVTGASLVGAGAALAFNVANRSAFHAMEADAGPFTSAEVEERRVLAESAQSKANLSGWTCYIAGGVGLALGVATVITW